MKDKIARNIINSMKKADYDLFFACGFQPTPVNGKRTEVEKYIANLPVDKSEFKFHQYRAHDYRRLHVTLSSLDLDMDDKIEICCQTHGQKSRDIFFKYFQWGLMQRRSQKKERGAGLKVFKTKNCS